jgi:phosphatidylglycerol:prolipoprotein diacylglycerol transferase
MIYWDPRPELFQFNIPFLGRPILWYGFLFALGFFLGYGVLIYCLKKIGQKKPKFYAEKLSFYVIVGMVLGARLGDVLFYQGWDELVRDPLVVVRVWEGGLASHGGAVGILIALWLFQQKYDVYSWLQWLDLIVIPAGLIGFFIRIGNFINQEVLGKVTDVPWAVVFGHPLNGTFPAPRHPVQLYEAVFYLVVFLLLFFLFLKKKWREGMVAGLFLTLVFMFRFVIEFWKEEQSEIMGAHAALDMGQLLSVPLVIFGLWLLFRQKRRIKGNQR